MKLKKFFIAGLFLIAIISLATVSANDNQTAEPISSLNDSALDTTEIAEPTNDSAKEDLEVEADWFHYETYRTLYPWDLEQPGGLDGTSITVTQTNKLYNITGNVTFYFDGEIVHDDANMWTFGRYQVTYVYWHEFILGKHTLTVTYSGDDHYRAMNQTFTYLYTRSYSKILESNNIYVRLANYMSGTFTVKITEKSTKKVIVKKMSVTGEMRYNWYGEELPIYYPYYIPLKELKKGKTYNIEVTFHGGKSKPYTTFTVLKQTFKATGNYRYVFSVCNDTITGKYGDSVNLRLNVNGKKIPKNQIVKIKIGKSTFNAKAYKDGFVKFTVPNTVGVGKHSMDVTYKGVKVSKKITVKHLLALKTVNVKKSAKKLVLQATLGKLAGKYLQNKKITFKFNGKKYIAKTNNKGVAKITVGSSVLKNLKVGKNVAYQATYLKDTVKKTVKVKK